jgi:hypothetical protein
MVNNIIRDNNTNRNNKTKAPKTLQPVKTTTEAPKTLQAVKTTLNIPFQSS